MILLVNVGQENKSHKRNNEPEGFEDGERDMGRSRSQRCEQHRYYAKQNRKTPNRGYHAHRS
jgi:hypothetical protein